MTTPDIDPLRYAVGDVARTLRDLHRALLDIIRLDYERRHGPVKGAGQMLDLVVNDPEFQWTRALSELMVDIDELFASGFVTPLDAAAVRLEVEALIASSEERPSDFATRYVEALHADPFLVIPHAEVRKTLSVLPQPEPHEIAEARRVRSDWILRRRPGSRVN